MLCNQLRIVCLKYIFHVPSRHFHPGIQIHARFIQKMAQEVKVYKTSVTAEGRLDITFQYQAEGIGKARVFNLSRPADEELNKCLARISANLSKKVKKKKKESASASSEDLEVCLLRNEERIDGDIHNSCAWTNGAVLKIGTTELQVREDPPTISKLSIPTTVMSNFGIYPSIDCSFTDLSVSTYSWYRSRSKNVDISQQGGNGRNCDDSSNTVTNDEDSNKDVNSTAGQSKDVDEAVLSDESGWEEVAKTQRYMVTDDDVGHTMKLVITPMLGSAGGDAKESNHTSVYRGPSMCPFEKRHQHTQNFAPANCFRIVSYNILANLYADSDYSRNFLFSYCPEYALAAHYRQQLVIKELLGYKADIICLQEVDRSFYNNELTDALEQADSPYTGLLALKPGAVGEGEATFYRKDRFRFVASHDIDMMEAFKTDPIHKELFEKIATNTPLQEKLLERKCVLQATVLESTDDKKRKLLVATSHFYFHPIADNIRLVQMAISLRHIEKIVQQYKQQGVELVVVYGGDFNSSPMYGVCRLATLGYIPSNTVDWYSAGIEQYVPGIELRQSLRLISACGEPAYTNFVGSFSGTLDHIFIDANNLRVKHVIPLPDHDDVIANTALPNAVFPSDHLALVCDVEWIK